VQANDVMLLILHHKIENKTRIHYFYAIWCCWQLFMLLFYTAVFTFNVGLDKR